MDTEKTEKVLKELDSIFSETLSDLNVNLELNTTAADVEGWDSLRHIELIINIETFYSIKFSTKEIMSIENIGSLVDLINKKIEL